MYKNHRLKPTRRSEKFCTAWHNNKMIATSKTVSADETFYVEVISINITKSCGRSVIKINSMRKICTELYDVEDRLLMDF